MTLYELSMEYNASAEALRGRIRELRAQAAQTESESDCLLLQARIRALSAMLRDTREIAVLTEHYYERGYCRNAKYII